jgi:flavin reductase (DIM6/NTAB) family NADH-FMN oxidoreductase RutF
MIAANWIPGRLRKDTCRNIQETGEFVWNMATYDLREAVNKSAANVRGDEFEFAGLTKEKARLVQPWRVKESPVQFECKFFTSLMLPGDSVMGNVDLIIGRVVGVHIREWALNAEGMIDLPKIKPIARCGYYQYTVVERLNWAWRGDADGRCLI